MKNFIGRFGKKLAFIGTSATAIVVGGVMSFAADTVDVTGALTTGIAEIQTQAMSAISAVAPVAIAITGAVLGVRIGIRAFRSIVG